MTRAISRESCPRVGFGLGTEQGVRNVTKLWIRRAPLEKGHEFKKKKKRQETSSGWNNSPHQDILARSEVEKEFKSDFGKTVSLGQANVWILRLQELNSKGRIPVGFSFRKGGKQEDDILQPQIMATVVAKLIKTKLRLRVKCPGYCETVRREGP